MDWHKVEEGGRTGYLVLTWEAVDWRRVEVGGKDWCLVLTWGARDWKYTVVRGGEQFWISCFSLRDMIAASFYHFHSQKIGRRVGLFTWRGSIKEEEELVSRTICLQIKRLLTVVSSSMSRAGQGSLASLEDVGDTSDFRGAKQIKTEKTSV
jgi:hypothetical protein